MRVDELITLLSKLDPKAEVCIAQPRHGYWKHVAAAPVRVAVPACVDVRDDVMHDPVPDAGAGRFATYFRRVILLSDRDPT